MRLRVATWNINSLRLRLPLLDHLRQALDPDVICLQETKVPDDLFPGDGPAAIGYPYVARRGMKGYNGVAILSRLPIEPDDLAPDCASDCAPDCAPDWCAPNWCGKSDCRHIAVRLQSPSGPVELHDFYVPAGGDVPDTASNPKFAHKLAFVQEATNWFAARAARRCILVGDLNIAPLEQDVWSHKQLLTVVSHTPVEVAHMEAWLRTGFVDAIRHFVPADQKLYTWWSYRNRDWKIGNRGRRLDHIWVTPDLVGALQNMTVLTEARDWTRGSDHVPVCVELDL